MSTPIVGLIMGVIFGASLVLAGLADPDKIIGALRLKDFHVIRTVAVFVLVGMLGMWILQLGGTTNLSIKPSTILTVLIGGAFVGIGLGLTGYCPGTGLACAASGRIDALFAVLGMFFGAHTYILIYPSIVVRLEGIFDFGGVTLPQITGTSPSSWIIPIFAAGSLGLLLTRRKKPRDVEQSIRAGDLIINEYPSGSVRTVTVPRTNDLLLKTDSLEAARVFRMWKNLLFIVTMLCLLLLQTSFWLVRTVPDKMSGDAGANKPVAFGSDENKTDESVKQNVTNSDGAIETTLSVPIEVTRKPGLAAFDISFERIALVVHFANIILVFTSVLYVLTLFSCLAISFGGGLGGISHICRAVYLSMVMLVLLLPWQIVFGSTVLGAIYTPGELVKWCSADTSGRFDIVLLNLRFTGYWALVILLLFLAQLRSFRWTKTSLVRLRKTVSKDVQREPPAL